MCRGIRTRFLALPVALAAWLALASFPHPAGAQAIDTTLWVTNGAVNSIAVDGDILYVGGAFSLVGPATGGGVPVSPSTGQPNASFPKVTGYVYAIVSDGAGGWFIGGAFTAVGGLARSNVAEVLNDGTVGAWNPGANGLVASLAFDGTWVYAGGEFTSIGGQSRNRIAAIGVPSGAASGWNPNANGSVLALVVSGGIVYVAGEFTSIGGQPRARIAALGAVNGLATSWAPDANAPVRALVRSGNTLYAGGAFTTIGGQPRNDIAALDVGSNTATGWDPSANGELEALAVSGGIVYAGGLFGSIGGQSRNGIAALDSTSGAATSWNPNADSPVFALAVDGPFIYAGGSFSTIGGQGRVHVAQLSNASGTPTPWSPTVDGTVHAVLPSGSAVYLGGTFGSIGGQLRTNLAALTLSTGTVTSWDPKADDVVRAVAVSGSTVYAGGDFTKIGGQTRSYLAALDATSAGATAWDAHPVGPIYSIAAQGSKVYVAGNFSQIGGQSRNYLAALDATTALATPFDPDANSEVDALAIDGATVYVGGYFTGIGGQSRSRIAALDATTGAATSWDPNANDHVSAIVVDGSTVYAAGGFTSIGGQLRGHLAAVDATTAANLTWNPVADSMVTALASNGPLVYAGGEFTSIGSQHGARHHLAALDPTASATGWDPNASGDVRALIVSGTTVYAGGSFTAIGNRPQGYVARMTASPAVAAIVPASGGDSGPVTATLTGGGLAPGTTVHLSQSGQPDIAGTGVVVAPDGLSLVATFDLTAVATGAWDVVVTTPDAQTATLSLGFAVEASQAPQLRVSLLGSTRVRSNRLTAFDVVIENAGNTDALAIPLWLTGIPASATVQLDVPLGPVPQAPGEPDWTQVPLTETNGGAQFLVIVIPRVPPGTTVRRVSIGSASDFVLQASLTPPWADALVFRACLQDGGVIQSGACVGTHVTAINATLTGTPGLQAVSGPALWSKIAWTCEGSNTLGAAEAKAAQILNYLEQPVVGGSVAASCGAALRPLWQAASRETVVVSVDPNGKFGPSGPIGNTAGQTLAYTVRFENDGSGDAQQVFVTDPLNGATLDWATASVDVISFGLNPATGRPYTVSPPPGVDRYQTSVDLRPARNMIVSVGMDLDRATGQLTWSFDSIDPATGQPPPLIGFLPPDQTPPDGEGSVVFSVSPRSGLAAGTTISNQATITFDGTVTPTPSWSNTVTDTTRPMSHMLPLPSGEDSATFAVHWQAMSSPDVQDFTIYVAKDGGPFGVWRLNTPATADTFQSQRGHAYAFYSQARDSTGNRELAHTSPDAHTLAPTSVDRPAPLALSLDGAHPNPTVGTIHARFALPSGAPATLDLVDVTGRRVLRREVGRLGPGRHGIDLRPPAPLSPGLYFLRLAQAGRALTARVAIVR